MRRPMPGQVRIRLFLVRPRVAGRLGIRRRTEHRGWHRIRPGGSSLGAELATSIAGLRGSGAPLSDSVRASFEPRLGVDLSGVRVQSGPEAAELAQRLDARAFTVGRDVFFNAGQYQPESAEGRRLLAHELAHVVQEARPGPAGHDREQTRRRRRA